MPLNIRCALFDLDGTVTFDDTDMLWTKWRLRHLRGFLEALWLRRIGQRYKKGTLSIKEYVYYQKFRVLLRSRKDFDSMSRDFFNEAGRGTIVPDMECLIKELSIKNILRIIITAQTEEIAKHFHQYLGTDKLISAGFSKIGNGFGSPNRPYCFGEGKIELARSYLHPLGIDFKDCAFFTDSIHDLPLLSVVGFAVAVNPDRYLLEEARLRGWTVFSHAKY